MKNLDKSRPGEEFLKIMRTEIIMPSLRLRLVGYMNGIDITL